MGDAPAGDLRFFSEFAGYSQEISRRIAAFPERLDEPLRSLARPLADRYPAEAWTHPYSFPLAYLPLWLLARGGRLGGNALLEPAASYGYATNCGYLYIRLQDDVYDEPGQPRDARMLLVANELILECLGGFARWFPFDSPFWRRFRAYWEEFSQATLWEMEHHVGRHEPFYRDDVIRQGRKLSLAKAPCAAAAHDLGCEARLPEIEAAIDCLQAANQLANDIAGLVRDIDAGNVTYPLTLATGPDFDWSAPGRRALAIEAVVQSSAIETTFDLAMDLHDQSLGRMGDLASPHYDEFVAWRKRFLLAGREDYSGLKVSGLLGLA
jgi:hypothetical protein